MNILTIPQDEKTLRQKSSSLDPKLIMDKNMQKFFDNLSETMFEADGAGLAAPQVGKLIRVAAINIDGNPLILINPEMTKKSFFKDIIEEGCLSIPGVYDKVKRPKNITIKYLDRNNQPQKTKFKNMVARIIQHEIDHMNGVLFIDKIIK